MGDPTRRRETLYLPSFSRMRQFSRSCLKTMRIPPKKKGHGVPGQSVLGHQKGQCAYPLLNGVLFTDTSNLPFHFIHSTPNISLSKACLTVHLC